MKWKISGKELWKSCGWSKKSNNLSHPTIKSNLGTFFILEHSKQWKLILWVFHFLTGWKEENSKKRFLFHMCVTVIYVLGRKTNPKNLEKLFKCSEIESPDDTSSRKTENLFERKKKVSREFLKKSLFSLFASPNA